MKLFDVYPLFNINIVKGEGCYVWDENGTEYLDLYGGHAVISIGVLYAFVDYITRLFNPVTGIVNQFAQLEHSLVAAERVFNLMDREGEPVSDEKLARYEGNIQFQNVWFAYNHEEYVLKDLSFEAKKGETVALVGRSDDRLPQY